MPDIRVATSEYILAETADKLHRKFQMPDDKVAQMLMKFRNNEAVHAVEPAAVATDACADAKDLPVLGTAVAAQADFLISGDAHLLALTHYQKIRIVSPRQLLDLLNAARHKNLDMQ